VSGTPAPGGEGGVSGTPAPGGEGGVSGTSTLVLRVV
jgi:hypothetical protein